MPDMTGIVGLLTDVFTGEQRIPSQMIPLPPETQPQWWCAEQGGAVIGAVAAWREEDEVHLGRFAIRQDCRGQHVGSRLAKYAVADLFRQGYEELHAEARPLAVKLLCAMGARVSGPGSDFFEGTVTPVVLRREDCVVQLELDQVN